MVDFADFVAQDAFDAFLQRVAVLFDGLDLGAGQREVGHETGGGGRGGGLDGGWVETFVVLLVDRVLDGCFQFGGVVEQPC